MKIKYDDIDWHYNDEFPKDLDKDCARTHMALFLGWAIIRGLAGEVLDSVRADQMQSLRQGHTDAKLILAECCDDKITGDDLSDAGNAFALAYYESTYLDDYVNLSDDGLPTIYHEPYSARKASEVYSLLDSRYLEWQAGMKFSS